MRHRPARIATVLALIAMVMLPGAMVAHSELKTPTPADRAIVGSTPTTIAGTFTQDVDPDRSSLQLRDASGTVTAEGRVDPNDPRRMVIDPVPDLAPGTYTVRWTTFSAEDGEGPERGSWTFTVTAPPTAEPTPEPTPAPSATAVPTTEPTASPASSAAPSPSDEPGPVDPAGSGSDVLIAIFLGLALVAVAGGFLLRRRSGAPGA